MKEEAETINMLAKKVGLRAPLENTLIQAATLIHEKEEEKSVNAETRRRTDERGVFDSTRWKITVVVGSPAAVMALNLFLVEKFRAHYV